MNTNKNFIGYEYKEFSANSKNTSLFIDCYKSFGWEIDENNTDPRKIQMKRDRKIINKTELTRLQRHFEGCINEIDMLEKSKSSAAMIWSLTVGIIGTAFMAGSTFAVTAPEPEILLSIICAVPGFIGWITPYFIYKKLLFAKEKKIAPMIEKKYDEIYEICEKGNELL